MAFRCTDLSVVRRPWKIFSFVWYRIPNKEALYEGSLSRDGGRRAETQTHSCFTPGDLRPDDHRAPRLWHLRTAWREDGWCQSADRFCPAHSHHLDDHHVSVVCRAGGCTPSRDRTSKRDLEASACATCTSRHDFPREMDHGHRVALAQLARSFSGRVYSIGNPSIDQTSLEFLPVTLRYDLQRSGPEFLRRGASVLNSDVDQSPVAKLPSRDCGRSHSALPDVHSYSSRRCILWKSLPLVSSGNGDGACQSLSSDRNRLGSSRGRRCRRSRMLGPVAARVLLITRIT